MPLIKRSRPSFELRPFVFFFLQSDHPHCSAGRCCSSLPVLQDLSLILFALYPAMTRTVDQNWQNVQEETIVRWANSIIRGHAKPDEGDPPEFEIKDLKQDLKDGALIVLLDNLNIRQEKEGRVKVRNKRPKMQAHLRENLTACFKFMESENIKVVNIGKPVHMQLTAQYKYCMMLQCNN